MSEVTTPNSTVSNPEVDQIVEDFWEWNSDQLVRTFVLPNIRVRRSEGFGYPTVYEIEFRRPSDRFERLKNIDEDLRSQVERSVPNGLVETVLRQIVDRLDSFSHHLEDSISRQEFEDHLHEEVESLWELEIDSQIEREISRFFEETSEELLQDWEVTNG